MNKISVGILGATSYTGLELIHRLAFHPGVTIAWISSQSHAGEKLSSIFPELMGIYDDILIAPQDTQTKKVDCVFSCLPHAVSAELCIPFVKNGARVIDLSADFRLRDPAVYKTWYKHDHPDTQLLKEAVYGLPEMYREAIKSARIIANPGCYVTSVLLPLLPLFAKASNDIEWVIADSKSSVSGAGRTLKLSSHFIEANENFSAYSVGHLHRHTPEIEQELSVAAKRSVTITFSPHLVPINRGILSTIYIKTPLSAAECTSIAREAYNKEPFVRVRESSDLPTVRNIAGTNYCDIAYTAGDRGQPVIAVATLDNIVKGASGQALQNMNIMFGFDEKTGLQR